MRLNWVGVLMVAVVVSGCLTPSDRWLVDHLTKEEKAQLLVDRALADFQDQVSADAVDRIPEVRATLVLALDANPADSRATEGLRRIEAYLRTRQAETRTRLDALAAKTSLTDREKFVAVVLVDQLANLALPEAEVQKYRSWVSPLRAAVVQGALRSVEGAEATWKTSGTPGAAAAVAEALENLKTVAPEHPEVAAAARRFDEQLAAKTKPDLEAALKGLQTKDFSGALRLLTRAEGLFSASRRPTPSEATDLRYQVLVAWSQALLASKAYPEAAARIGEALALRATPEALGLRDRIAQAASFRDWDAEYDALDRQIDGALRSGDLATAWNLVTTGAPRLKKDTTKARVETRRKAVIEAAHTLYEAGVKAYNEEDYATAKAAFDTVAAVDPGWKLTRSYQDKARAKVQFLGGKP